MYLAGLGGLVGGKKIANMRCYKMANETLLTRVKPVKGGGDVLCQASLNGGPWAESGPSQCSI